MKPWTFVHVADIHVGSPRSFRFEPTWNENWQTAKKRILEIRPDLLLVGGDLARDGNVHRYELENVKAELDGLPFPYYVVPGNMDTGNKHARPPGSSTQRDDTRLNITSEQLTHFESVFGPSQWSCVHKNVRFSGFCDMLVNSGLPQEDSLWQWMEIQKNLPREAFHVWLMHYALFIDDPGEPNFHCQGSREQYLCWYFGVDNPGRSRLLEAFQAAGATHVISGHVHCRKTYHAGQIQFDIAPSTAFAQFHTHWKDDDPTLGFLRYDVSREAITRSFIALEKTSSKTGYGPGGHPRPEDRDYSRAWEK